MVAVAWIDTEFTSLDDPDALLLEVGLQLTDDRDRFLGAGVQHTLNVHPDEARARMPAHVANMHTKNGLFGDLSSGIPTERAEESLLAHWERHCPSGDVWLGGRNTQHDRSFLEKFMPQLAGRLHPYRVIDVCHQEWTAKLTNPRRYRTCPRPRVTHRALADAHMAIEQHRHLAYGFPRIRKLCTNFAARGAA